MCTTYHTTSYGSVRIQNHHFHYPWGLIPKDVKTVTFSYKGQSPHDLYIAMSPSNETEDDAELMPKISNYLFLIILKLCTGKLDIVHELNVTVVSSVAAPA